MLEDIAYILSKTVLTFFGPFPGLRSGKKLKLWKKGLIGSVLVDCSWSGVELGPRKGLALDVEGTGDGELVSCSRELSVEGRPRCLL